MTLGLSVKKLFPRLPRKKYAIIYADPPWDYKGQKQHTGAGGRTTGGALSHYDTVRLSYLKKLDVPSICKDDCLIFMWISSPHMDQGIELMKAWGFKWATIAFVWHKDKTNPGYYTLSECEMCIVGKRGRIPKPRGARNIRQFYRKLRGEHSVKPDEFRERIVQMFPKQKKIELFMPKKSCGWDRWGKAA